MTIDAPLTAFAPGLRHMRLRRASATAGNVTRNEPLAKSTCELSDLIAQIVAPTRPCEDTMATGYSRTPLVRKLGMKPGMTCAVVDPPDNYWDLVGSPDAVEVADPSTPGLDFVHVFVQEQQDLVDRLRTLRANIAQDGMIWVSWPKKASGVQTNVTREVVREAGLSAGLVDVKVCAVDEIWSGLKFVIRKADRR